MKRLGILFFGLLGFGIFAENFKPFEGAPPEVNLTADQQARVARGELVFLKDNTAGELKEGSVAFRVKARPDAIWKVLGDFSKYPEWSYRVGDARLYRATQGDIFYVDFTTDMLGYHYYVINQFPRTDWATWHTDHSQSNDCVLDTIGFWRLKSVAGNANQTDVIQYGKIKLTSRCTNGILGIGGFNAHDMADTIYENLRARAEAL